ncbi:MAG: sporulation protein YqfD [Heliobacteriaceae bacterium]|nr:sporulation protein YqfD [Heliobacteriaceae bacterium]MDD4586859.1 sporulation protein YqfD [Heliobacteriaceae bacterium]
MLRNWWLFWLGYVKVRATGTQLEKFINLAVGRGIPLFDLRRESAGDMSIKVRLDGFRSLRHVARKTHCHVKIEERSGFPFLWLAVRRYRSVCFGALMFVLIICLLSTVVWDVEVIGNERVDKPTILGMAAKHGVRVGTWKPLLDVRAAERGIMQMVSDLEWVGIHAKGTRITIEVQEKVLPKSLPIAGPVNIVAGKDGLVQRLLVLVGEGKVKEGDQVTKGQVLISGVIYGPPVSGEPDKAGNGKAQLVENVQAKGEVWSKVWYTAVVEEPVIREGSLPTGKVADQWRIKWGKQEIILKGPRFNPFPAAKEEVYVRTTGLWRNLQMPVEIIKTEYHELRPYRQERSPEEAVEGARGKARQQINAGLAPGGRVIREMVESPDAPPGMVRVKVAVEVLEDIATPQPAAPVFKPQKETGRTYRR